MAIWRPHSNALLVIARFEFFECVRNRWLLVYGLAFLVFANLIAWFSGDNALSASASLLSLVLLLVPLFALIFGSISFMQSAPFQAILAVQPIRRGDIFLGKWLGLSGGLAASYVAGMGAGALPRIGSWANGTAAFVLLLSIGVLLTFAFTGLAFLLANLSRRIEVVFGLALALWFHFFVAHDLLVLALVARFGDYPLETAILVLSILNPIDLARIMLTLNMDLSAMLGYTGAVFEKTLGGAWGASIGLGFLALWGALPALAGLRLFQRKDL